MKYMKYYIDEIYETSVTLSILNITNMKYIKYDTDEIYEISLT